MVVQEKGSGPKPKPIVALREKAIEEAGDDACYALGLYVQVMRDEERPIDLRLQCAKEVKDTVWGKPPQRTQISGEDGGPVHVTLIEVVKPGEAQTESA